MRGIATDHGTFAETRAVEPECAEPLPFDESAETRSVTTGELRAEKVADDALAVLAGQLIPDRRTMKRPNRNRPRDAAADLPSYDELREMAKRSGPPKYLDGDRAEENPF